MNHVKSIYFVQICYFTNITGYIPYLQKSIFIIYKYYSYNFVQILLYFSVWLEVGGARPSHRSRLFCYSTAYQLFSENVLTTNRVPNAVFPQGVSFTLRPGKVTALVGPSGSGKSSCVSLLENFYLPQKGRVLLDGKPVHTYRHDYLHSKVGL